MKVSHVAAKTPNLFPLFQLFPATLSMTDNLQRTDKFSQLSAAKFPMELHNRIYALVCEKSTIK